MNDIELSELTHDLKVVNGDLVLLNEESQVSKQTVKINLLTYLGEWFLDSEVGVPYFQRILGRLPDTTLPDTIIIGKVLGSYGVVSVESLDSSISTDRVYTIDNIKATTVEGEIISISTTT